MTNIEKISQQGWIEDNNMRVQWLLSNQCSMKCDYCPEWFNNGDKSWPTLEVVNNFISTLSSHYKQRNRLINFSLVGGEVTEFPYIQQLLQGLTDEGIRSEIMTNASKPISFWEENKWSLNQVIISYHYNKVTWEHIQEVISTLISGNVKVILHFMMTPEHFNDILVIKSRAEAYRESIDDWFHIEMRPLYKDYGFNEQFYDYTEEQLAFIRNSGDNNTLDIETKDGGVVNDCLIKRTIDQNHNYEGMYCYIGIEQLIVHSDGYVYRGWCWEGGSLGNVVDGVNFPTRPIICTRKSCKNGMDQLSTKSKTEL